MAQHLIEYRRECKACGGTGIYVGFAEHDGAGVVCSNCKGLGFNDVKISYNDFEGLKPSPRTTRVFQFNPGICIAKGDFEGEEIDIEDFGGIPYTQWIRSKGKFPEKTEMRKFVCPRWWYQYIDSDRKPRWDGCIKVGSFSNCSFFPEKDKCWDRWDSEFGKQESVDTNNCRKPRKLDV